MKHLMLTVAMSHLISFSCTDGLPLLIYLFIYLFTDVISAHLLRSLISVDEFLGNYLRLVLAVVEI